MNSKQTIDDGRGNMIQRVLPFAGAMSCPRSQQLITTGEEAECFYYVENGTFEVSYETQQTSIVVALIGTGNFFGEIGFFDRRTRTRNVQAVEDAQLRVFDRSAMAQIQQHDPILYGRFVEFLLNLVCLRFRRTLPEGAPLNIYAADLSTGREHFQGLKAIPAELLQASQWQAVNRQIEEFKAGFFDLAYRLQKDEGPEISPELLVEGESRLDAFNGQLRHFEQNGLPEESLSLMWGYVFKELFPYFMRSRFAERAYYKPKGYAGDFLMMELIYRQQPEGDGKLGTLIDSWLLKQAPAQAVRNRRRLLRKLLDQIFRKRLENQSRIHLINLACGPSRELFDLLADCDYSPAINALCIDIDSEALQYANQRVNTFSHQASVKFMRENVVKWALGRARHDLGYQDVIYSSGLCDYLDRRLMLRLIRRCHDQLKPGGVLILGNFSTANPDRQFLDHVLYWRLIHRDEEEMGRLFRETPFGGRVRFTTEEQGVNLFAIATRAE